jgi:outer membrane protein assembly factor BamB
VEQGSLRGAGGFGTIGRGRADLPNGCPAYADGVVWVYDTAFDADTGKVLWTGHHGNGTPSPVVWNHQGTNYFISGGGVCVEPRSGKVRWKAAQAPSSMSTPTIGDGYMVLGGLQACYRITPEGVEEVWRKGPQGFGGDMGSSSVIHNGHVYAQTRGDLRKEKHGKSCRGNLVCVELATGKEISRVRSGSNSGSVVPFGPWILHEFISGTIAGKDVYDSSAWGVYRADPTSDTLGLIGGFRIEGPYQDTVTPAIVGSRIYVRGGEHVYCYDLAKE